MFGYKGKRLINAGPQRRGTPHPGATYGNLFQGKTARDSSLISGVSDKDGLSALW